MPVVGGVFLLSFFSHPNAPVPVVISSTRTPDSSSNWSSSRCRFDISVSPSIRTKSMPSARRCRPTRSRVLVQQENTMLRERRLSLA